MDSIEQIYLQIILEAQYETDIWKKYGEYKKSKFITILNILNKD